MRQAVARFIAAMVTTAKASLISYRSTASARPAGLLEQLARCAPTGAVVNQPAPAHACCAATIVASGVSPRRSGGGAAHQHQRGAAPSEMELELAAVTVPSLRNAGLSLGILSRIGLERLLVALSMKRSPLPALQRDGHDLPGEPAFVVGFLRPFNDFTAKASCSARVKLVLPRAVFGEGAHQAAFVVGILEAVEEHVVDAPADGPCGSRARALGSR